MSRNTKKAAVRQPTTFQLLQSKYLSATSRPALTHRREVGTLNSKRVHRVKEVDKPISGTGQEVKGGRFRVRDMIAKFAAVEQKEKEHENKDLVGQVNKGLILSDMMKRIEDLSNLHKRSDIIEHRKQECADECEPTGMTKMAKQKKVEDLLILDKRTGQVMGKCTTSKIHSSSLEKQQSSLAIVKCSPRSLLVAEKDLVSPKLVSSLFLTQQTVSSGRIKVISFCTLLVESHPEPENGLSVMENPQKCNLAIVLPHPDIWELACSTRESLEPCNRRQHLWELQPHTKGAEEPCKMHHEENDTAEFVRYKDQHSPTGSADYCRKRPLQRYNDGDSLAD